MLPAYHRLSGDDMLFQFTPTQGLFLISDQTLVWGSLGEKSLPVVVTREQKKKLSSLSCALEQSPIVSVIAEPITQSRNKHGWQVQNCPFSEIALLALVHSPK